MLCSTVQRPKAERILIYSISCHVEILILGMTSGEKAIWIYNLPHVTYSQEWNALFTQRDLAEPAVLLMGKKD